MHVVIEVNAAGVPTLEVDGEAHEFHHERFDVAWAQAFLAASAALSEPEIAEPSEPPASK